MTRLEVIQMIGDLLTEIDVARGSLMPNDPNRQTLDDQRILLDDRQRKLAQSVFNDNSKAFQKAAAELAAVNREISGTIQSVEDIVTTIGNIQRFLDTATSLVKLVASFV
ncbi:MAG TPA: hypothetical protein VGF08_06875 [Terriglobales bacterium]|jgi:hypothetical protein